MKDKVQRAFSRTPRELFLPPDMLGDASLDAPLPIGYGSTNSQPTTVRLMLEWLDVQSEENVLDVGSGSGWTAALLSRLVGPKGKVTAVERIPELVEFGSKNCKKLNVRNINFQQAGKVLGYPKKGPYQRILVSAAAKEIPKKLVQQLDKGGRLVIPVQGSIVVLDKDTKSRIQTTEHTGFAFVPLVS